jgi:ATPase subunit of ABC transporter with duplicated ATPase domains
LRGLGFKKAMVDGPYASLSGGWRSRCRLATALLVQTDLLLLDEPTNFMVSDSILRYEMRDTLYVTVVITHSYCSSPMDTLIPRTWKPLCGSNRLFPS